MKIVLTPDWFLGKDVIIDFFSFIVLAAFFILCWRYYKLNKKNNLIYLGLGFLLISIAQLANIFTKLVLYYDATFVQHIGNIIVTYNMVKSVDFFYYAGFFFHRLLTLAGLYLIYRLPAEKKTVEDFILAVYFLIISAVFGINAEYFFHLTVLLLLGLIIHNYYKIYKKNKNENTKVLIIAFAILALAHLLFTISAFSQLKNLYAISNLIELVSYLILLFLIIRILRCDKRR